MSAWYLMSSLGFYPVDPVSGNYIRGSPLFERATLQLAEGRRLDIVVHRKSPSDIYIQFLTLNGVHSSRSWFHHDEIARGGSLVFKMGPNPNPAFGSHAADLPPSFQFEMA
jgi:putative alpha-1,2-mannosidase